MGESRSLILTCYQKTIKKTRKCKVYLSLSLSLSLSLYLSLSLSPFIYLLKSISCDMYNKVLRQKKYFIYFIQLYIIIIHIW